MHAEAAYGFRDRERRERGGGGERRERKRRERGWDREKERGREKEREGGREIKREIPTPSLAVYCLHNPLVLIYNVIHFPLIP